QCQVPRRGWMGQRTPGRKHERGKGTPIGLRQVFNPQTCGARPLARVLIVIPDGDMGASCNKRLRRDKARTAKTKHGDMLATVASDRRHDYLSFKVERPIKASTKAMIQKRTTTCGSDQPSCSKWWWMGAILKTRLPVSLKEATWTITDKVSRTKRPPTMARTISCLTATAMVPSAPPRAREPVSPIKICA